MARTKRELQAQQDRKKEEEKRMAAAAAAAARGDDDSDGDSLPSIDGGSPAEANAAGPSNGLSGLDKERAALHDQLTEKEKVHTPRRPGTLMKREYDPVSSDDKDEPVAQLALAPRRTMTAGSRQTAAAVFARALPSPKRKKNVDQASADVDNQPSTSAASAPQQPTPKKENNTVAQKPAAPRAPRNEVAALADKLSVKEKPLNEKRRSVAPAPAAAPAAPAAPVVAPAPAAAVARRPAAAAPKRAASVPSTSRAAGPSAPKRVYRPPHVQAERELAGLTDRTLEKMMSEPKLRKAPTLRV